MNTGRHTLEVMNEAQWYNKWVFSLIKNHLKGDILEVGTGIGNFADMLSKKGKVTAIDIDRGYIEELKKTTSIDVGLGDIEKEKYFFGDKKFDSIVSMNVVEHIKRDENAIRNMYNLLKKGGKLILLVPAHQFLFSNFDEKLGHFRRYSKSEVERLVERAGFEDVSVRHINWWGAFGWFVFMKLSGRNSMPRSPVKIFDYFARALLFPEKFIKMPFGLSIIAIAEKP
jgi:SAM-dependent methyltransferase